jgi:hypothetical protein
MQQFVAWLSDQDNLVWGGAVALSCVCVSTIVYIWLIKRKASQVHDANANVAPSLNRPENVSERKGMHLTRLSDTKFLKNRATIACAADHFLF